MCCLWRKESKQEQLKQVENMDHRIEDAERVEHKALLSLRAAQSVSDYLKRKNASSEKKLVALKSEKRAQIAWQQAHTRTTFLRMSLTGVQDDHLHDDVPSVVSSDDGSHESQEEREFDEEIVGEKEPEELSFTDKICLGSLAVLGIVMAMK